MSIQEIALPPLTDDTFGAFSVPNHDNFALSATPQQRRRIFAWLDACPVPAELEEIYGLEWITNRYGECNFVGSLILEKARELNPDLADALTTTIDRPIGHYPRKYEDDAVPIDFTKVLNPGQQPVNYAAPRVLIEQFGRDPQWKIGDERVTEGLRILELALRDSSTPEDFLIYLAALAVRSDADRYAVLSHVFAVEFKDEGTIPLVHEVALEMESSDPELWDFYLSIPRDERIKRGILSPFDLF